MRRLVLRKIARKNRNPEQYKKSGDNELDPSGKWRLLRNQAKETDQEALKLQEKRRKRAREIPARVEQMTDTYGKADKEKTGERGTNLRNGDEEVVPGE